MALEKLITNPVKAIRAKCLDCTRGQPKEIRLCRIEDCALYRFRAGTNPYRKRRTLSPKQQADARNRLHAPHG